jgi:hypothetical protein
MLVELKVILDLLAFPLILFVCLTPIKLLWDFIEQFFKKEE